MIKMAEEKIIIHAKRKNDIKELGTLFGDLGYARIAFANDELTIEKIKGTDLSDHPIMEYRVEFGSDEITFVYNIPANKNNLSRLLEVLPTFLNILQLVDKHYEVEPSAAFSYINTVLAEVSKITDRETIEFSTQLSDLQIKYNDLKAKYQDLVRSSEANTRILLECEQKKEELSKKVAKLSGMSNELLKEVAYEWIKVHSGSMDIREFAKAHIIPLARAEEGLNLLIQEGYIKRRFD